LLPHVYFSRFKGEAAEIDVLKLTVEEIDHKPIQNSVA
jgi:hypothetical protein